MEGVSLAYTFADAQAKSRHVTQYFEIAGNRAIYDDGWLARTVHRAPWEQLPRAPLAQDKWELYDRANDFSLANDLAAKYPQKLSELQALFLEEAVKYDVLPIDDRSIERLDPAAAGRPDLMQGRTTLTLYDGMTGMLENAFINVKNRSSLITAEVELPSERRERRDPGPGGTLRRLEPLPRQGPARVRLQLDRPRDVHDRVDAALSRPAGPRSSSTSRTTAVGAARAPPPRCS